MTEKERLGGLAVDIDTRLLDIWIVALTPGSVVADAFDSDPAVRDAVGGLLRAAYGQGYNDALNEDRAGRRAELHKAHGYRPA